MNASAFADTTTGFLRSEQVWRQARPVLVLFSSLALALAARERGWTSPIPAAATLTCIVLLLAGRFIRTRIAAHPTWAPLGLELELCGLVPLVMNALAGLLFGLAALTAHVTDKALAYFVGVLAGASVGYFSKEIFTAAESDSWFAAHYRASMNRLFLPFFLRRAGHRWVRGPRGRWAPWGEESDALATNSYDDQGEHVSGWNAHARRQRARTLDTGLRKPPWTPADPS